jgi:hypothetical protein
MVFCISVPEENRLIVGLGNKALTTREYRQEEGRDPVDVGYVNGGNYSAGAANATNTVSISNGCPAEDETIRLYPGEYPSYMEKK